uniref:UDP-glucose:glycoprotein glucosyltransferase n=1 Tax=Spongospora subterranea TaxID=70186 RepID=A0A0H5QX78_9EUKA|eukprot:CRZ06598.1 hypothetical protein [Spongospora subterranea]
MRLPLIAWHIAIASISIASSAPLSSTLSVQLQSQFGSGSISHQSVEHFGSISPSLFWSSVSWISAISPENDRDAYTRIMASCIDMYSSLEICSTLHMSLVLNAYSPRLESNYRLLLESVEKSDGFSLSACQGDPVVIYGNGQASCGFNQSLLRSKCDVDIFEFDHVHPNRTTGPAIIVYADLSNSNFTYVHQQIIEHNGPLRYILRLSNFDHQEAASFPMNGFGVELAFKNMEYNVLDDRNQDKQDAAVNGIFFGQLKQRFPASSAELSKVVAKLQEGLQDDLRIWDIAKFGLQASQRVVSSRDSLTALSKLACDFPKHASSLKSVKVSQAVSSGIAAVHEAGISPGQTSLFINNVEIDLTEFDMFALQEWAVKESGHIAKLTSIGLSSENVDFLLQANSTSDSSHASYPPSGPTSPRLDTRSESITWMNDLESDSRYDGWGRSVSQLEYGYPGQLRMIALNLYSCVAVIDPTTFAGLTIVEHLKQFVKANAPLRVGVIFNVQTGESLDRVPVKELKDILDGISTFSGKPLPADNRGHPQGELIAKLFKYLNGESKKKSFAFLSALQEKLRNTPGDRASINVIRSGFLKVAGTAAAEIYENIASGNETEYGSFVTDCSDYVQERNIKNGDFLFINGVEIKEAVQYIHSGQMFNQLLLRGMLPWQRVAMIAVQMQQLTDATNLEEYIFGGDDVVSCFDSVIQKPKDEWKFTSDLDVDVLLSPPSDPYYLVSEQPGSANLTMWLYGDLDSKDTAALAFNAIRHLASPKGHGKRLALFLTGPGKQNFSVNSVVGGILALHEQHPGSIAAAITTVLASRLVSKSMADFQNQILNYSSENELVKQALEHSFTPQIMPGIAAPSLIVNGRIIPISDRISPSSFDLLIPIPHLPTLPSDVDADTLMKVAGCLGARFRDSPSFKPSNFARFSNLETVLHYPSGSHFKVVAVVSPLSEACQRIISVLVAFRDHLHWDVTLVLNPSLVISAVPIKRYYRYVFQADLKFDDDGRVDQSNVHAHFSLPSTLPVATLSMETSEPWLVESVHTDIDLDNIQIGDDVSAISVAFALRHLLVFGSCLELSPNPSPPAGLKVFLGTPLRPHQQDTIVMENLGYFQLKASPNVWQMSLSPGQAAAIFRFPMQNLLPSPAKDIVYHPERLLIPVRSFSRYHLRIYVSRQPGMEMVDLLELTNPETSSVPSFWGKISESVFGGESDSKTIHIFSIASGHLYERFLRIMMASVVKRMRTTKYKIKFWFVGQFLSPQFKTSIQEFADRYGCTVELVVYKWPNWLRRQREKQRTIWGYKILFLDVLFPINLDRVIFIDADQIVRGDISELWNLDLKGNPYAYTPFCDSNTLTEGFRFWKGGFWHDHLRGKPYHISALYVVDLRQFRKLRAGDTLRAIYDNLSADPNSLANLDQDLPNYAQHHVGIYSLPQEWLWCETWCSMESLGKAKTIDLCNNPMTKESKLSRARRLLPEWTPLDHEANPDSSIGKEEESDKVEL